MQEAVPDQEIQDREEPIQAAVGSPVPVRWPTALRRTLTSPAVLFPMGNGCLAIARGNVPAGISEAFRFATSGIVSFRCYRAGLQPDAGYYTGAGFLAFQGGTYAWAGFAGGNSSDFLLAAAFGVWATNFSLRGYGHSLENAAATGNPVFSGALGRILQRLPLPDSSTIKTVAPFLQNVGEALCFIALAGGKSYIPLSFISLSVAKAGLDLFRSVEGADLGQRSVLRRFADWFCPKESDTAFGRFGKTHLADPMMIQAYGFAALAMVVFPPHTHPWLFAANSLYAFGMARLSFATDDLGKDFRAAAREVGTKLGVKARRLAFAGAAFALCVLRGDAPGSLSAAESEKPAREGSQIIAGPRVSCPPLLPFLVARAAPAA